MTKPAQLPVISSLTCNQRELYIAKQWYAT